VILNNELKLIKSLRVRTSRYGERLFVAEGSRLVLDILKTNPSLLHLLAGTADWIKRNEAKLSGFVNILREIAPRQLSDVAGLKTTEEVLAIVKFPEFDQDCNNVPEYHKREYNQNSSFQTGCQSFLHHP